MRLLILTLISVLTACSSAPQTENQILINIEDEILSLEVKNQDHVTFQDYIIFGSETSYISFSSQSTAEENEHYNLSTVELIRQVYGFTPPQSDEVNATKQAILKDVIERRELPHDKYVAVFHQISDGTERIFFTFKRSRKETNTLYLIESRNRDSIKAFYGRN